MRLVVIGGVAAGMSAAARARRADPSLEIVVLEKGPQVSWAACGLPYLLSGRVNRPEDLIIRPAESFQRERNIGVRTGAEVAAIQPSRRQVALCGGERLAYDRLVIATGARPERAVAGADQPHVFTLHTLEDGRRIRAFLEEQRPRRAAVIGGGYIGLETADALAERGLAVTLFEAGADLLGRADPELTRRLAEHLEGQGIELRLNTPITAVEDLSAAGAPAELVILAARLHPNVELAAEAGIELGRTGAVRVTDRMETNLAGIYAAGDCIETLHLVTGGPVYLPLGTTANKTGRVAGANAAGARERFPGVAGTMIVALRGLAAGVTGLSPAQARKEGFQPTAVHITAEDRSRYLGSRPTLVELVADRRTRRLLGGAVLGERGVAGRVNVIAAALTAGMAVEQLAQLDLAYAPPLAPVWDPLLLAARALLKELG